MEATINTAPLPDWAREEIEREQARQSRCAGKTPYSNMSRASVRATTLSVKLGTAMTAYKCKDCPFIHIGKDRDGAANEN
jgi:hypothetical protein